MTLNYIQKSLISLKIEAMESLQTYQLYTMRVQREGHLQGNNEEHYQSSASKQGFGGNRFAFVRVEHREQPKNDTNKESNDR